MTEEVVRYKIFCALKTNVDLCLATGNETARAMCFSRIRRLLKCIYVLNNRHAVNINKGKP